MKKCLQTLVPILIASALLLLNFSTLQAAPSIKLKLSHAYPEKSLFNMAIIKPWIQEIENASNGGIQITNYAAQALSKMPNAYDDLVSGMSDLAVVATGMTPGRFPMSEIDTLPMLYPSGEITGRVYHELMQKYAFDKEFKEVKFLYALPLPPAQLFLRKPVKTLEDLKGLTLRIEGKVEGKTFEALGASGVMVNLMELYGSLERGLVDGAAFVPNGVLIFGINKITKYRVKADLFCRAFPMLMNKDKFNSLPPEIQKLFQDHSGIAYSIRWGKLTDGVQMKSLKEIAAYDQQAGNPGFYALPIEERARWKERVMPIWDEWVQEKEARGLPAKAMLNEAVQLIDKYSGR